jgi:hypothetical protein
MFRGFVRNILARWSGWRKRKMLAKRIRPRYGSLRVCLKKKTGVFSGA